MNKAGVLALLALAACTVEPDDAAEPPGTTIEMTAETFLPPETSQPPETTTTAAPTTTVATTVTAPPPPAETAAQRNARRQAESYIRSMPFSREGLIKQLAYEGYSAEDAAYGADNIVVDWNEQAARQAAQYLESMPFSRQGLYDQLIYEGYTPEQAEHGVSTTGL